MVSCPKNLFFLKSLVLFSYLQSFKLPEITEIQGLDCRYVVLGQIPEKE